MGTPVSADQKKLTSALCRHWVPSRGLTKIGMDNEKESKEFLLLVYLDNDQ